MIALAISPALAPGRAAPYVIAAYAVFLAVILTYVAIMARRLVRTERDLGELKRELDRSRGDSGGGWDDGPGDRSEDRPSGGARGAERQREPVG